MVEQVVGVVRAGGGLRVVLHREGPAVDQPDSLHHTVVGAGVADDRRTEVIDESGEIRIEDLIAEEDMAITVSSTGYIKRTAISAYRSQRRGGKGLRDIKTTDRNGKVVDILAVTDLPAMVDIDNGYGAGCAALRILRAFTADPTVGTA